MKKLSKKTTIITLISIGIALAATIYIIDKTGPQTADEYCRRALRKSTYRKNKEAIKDYERAISLEPKNSRGYSGRADINFSLGKYKEAIKDYSKAIKLSEYPTSGYVDRARCYFNLKMDKKAFKDFDKAIELDPKSAFAYYERGEAKMRLRRYKEAFKDFDKAIRRNPNSESAYSARGVAYIELGKYEEAIKDYEKCLEIFPECIFTPKKIAYAKRKLGKYEEAIEIYNKILKEYPKYGEYYIHRGNAKSESGKNKEAIKDYDKVIEMYPQYAWAYNCRGLAKKKLKQYKEAIKDYKKAESFGNLHATSRIAYFYVYGWGVEKDMLKAKKILQKTADKNHHFGQNDLAYFIAEYGTDYAKAEKLIKKALKQHPDVAAYIDTYGWILYKQKKYNPALEQLLKADKLVSGQPAVIDHIGDAYFALGKKQEAEKYWKEALKLYLKDKDNPVYPEYIKKIKLKLKKHKTARN